MRLCTCECGWGEGAQHLTHSVVNCACPGMAVLNPDNFPLTVYVPHERICMPCETVWIQDRIVVCFVGVHLYIYVSCTCTLTNHNGDIFVAMQ